MSAPTLRPYQCGQIDALCKAAQMGDRRELGPWNRLLGKSPTGTGKTVMFSGVLNWPAVKTWLEQFPEKERRMLVIAHREELLDQAAEKMRRANPHLMISIDQGERRASVYSDVVIASIQTLSAMQFRRLKRLLSRMVFRIVVIDEAHHAAAASYRTALVHLGFLPPSDASDEENIEATNETDIGEMEANLEAWDKRAPKDRLLIGITATPNRSDSIGLGCVFQHIAFSYALKDAIKDGWLVPIVPWAVESAVDLDQVRVTHGDFNQRDLAKAVNEKIRNTVAVTAWHEYGQGRPTLAFTVDIQHAHDLAQHFRDAGVSAFALSGETPKEERRKVLRKFLDGDITVITNCMVLTEGTDLPLASCILHAKPTKSSTLYEQMTGRGLRIHPGKTDCIVIDIVDIAKKHSLQAAPVLYGLPPGLMLKGEAVDEAYEEVERLLAKYPGLEEMLRSGRITLEQLKKKASTFNVFAIAPLGSFGQGLTMTWIKVGAESYRLQYPWADGIEVVQISKDLIGHFDVSLTLRPEKGDVRQRTLATQVASANEAAKLAEAFISSQRSSATKIVDKNAGWRKRPASDNQLALLRRRHIPIPPRLSMGEASQLIDQSNANKGR